MWCVVSVVWYLRIRCSTNEVCVYVLVRLVTVACTRDIRKRLECIDCILPLGEEVEGLWF